MNLLRLHQLTIIYMPHIQEGLESCKLPVIATSLQWIGVSTRTQRSRLDSAEHMHSTMVAKLNGS